MFFDHPWRMNEIGLDSRNHDDGEEREEEEEGAAKGWFLISFSVRFSSKRAESMREREKRRRGVLFRGHGGETAGEGT